MFAAGIAAVNPATAIQRHLRASIDAIDIDQTRHQVTGIRILALGKAAPAMTEAALHALGDHRPLRSATVVTHTEARSLPKNVDVIIGGHPLPDRGSQTAGERFSQQAMQATEQELLLVLISGGGSALLASPRPPITLADKITLTRQLLRSGMNIDQLNCVRKHVSTIKGGWLAQKAFPAPVHALILSDVVGDDLSAIASGPTVPDSTTFSDAVLLLTRYRLLNTIPKSVKWVLDAGVSGQLPETPDASAECFTVSRNHLIGSNRCALEAVAKAAERLKYCVKVFDRQLTGEARQVAKQLADRALEIAQDLRQPVALLAGGETTVTVTGHGRGGRNQELALAFAVAADNRPLPCRWLLLSAGTDGRDGPTDAAGAWVDAGTCARIKQQGLEPLACLDDNNAHAALAASGDLLITGATGTNVADLVVVLLWPQHT